MDSSKRIHQSHLFTLRVWSEELGDGVVEWRGRVQHVASGEARYFRGWPTLIPLLQAMLDDSASKQPKPDSTKEDLAGKSSAKKRTKRYRAGS